MIQEKYPCKALQDAVEEIGSLPGIGSRSALRLALNLLKRPAENITAFSEAIGRLATDVHYCKSCAMICDSDLCPICSDGTRDRTMVCVVAGIRDVLSIEATGQYRGLYHVLGGIISPIDGIGPGELTIGLLTQRLGQDSGIKELILALPGDVEGETTAFYIYRQVRPFGLKVTTLARGLGFSDGLEYADSLTLGRSISARTEFKP